MVLAGRRYSFQTGNGSGVGLIFRCRTQTQTYHTLLRDMVIVAAIAAPQAPKIGMSSTLSAMLEAQVMARIFEICDSSLQ